MSRPRIGKRGITIKCLASSFVHIETRVLVAYLFFEVHRDTTDRFGDTFETLEVDFDVVVDFNSEIGLDGVNQSLSTVGTVFALRECRIDSLFVP